MRPPSVYELDSSPSAMPLLLFPSFSPSSSSSPNSRAPSAQAALLLAPNLSTRPAQALLLHLLDSRHSSLACSSRDRAIARVVVCCSRVHEEELNEEELRIDFRAIRRTRPAIALFRELYELRTIRADERHERRGETSGSRLLAAVGAFACARLFIQLEDTARVR